ncbi:MAG: DUF2520 domain-containing protein [Gemmatimonadaceae bacterium]|nr:DUF2520 domain-containing protein [Gemmatimonadaceae bacterium]
MSERVFVIGAGQVGRGLSRAFRASGVEVLALHGRKPSELATSHGDLPDSIRDANVVIIAVRDTQIAGVVAQLAGTEQRPMRFAPTAHPIITSGTVVLHTSGIAEVRSLDLLRAASFACGTFHPLAPFAIADRVAELLRGGWIGIDGDDSARSAARRLAGHLGARTLEIPAGGKPAYHAAAVMASNFPVVLAYAAAQLMHSAGISDRSAQAAVETLVSAAVGNLATASPVEALTGPVVRGDAETVRKHVEMLSSQPELLAVYRSLSEVALRVARERGTDSTVLAAIRTILGATSRP